MHKYWCSNRSAGTYRMLENEDTQRDPDPEPLDGEPVRIIRREDV